MSRTYIGPFGRILPLPDNSEPERLQLPVDETRTNMTTYQLPPPEKLQFGSDGTPGFTEPLRYNTISQSSQSRRSFEPSNTMYRERSRQPHREHLPSLSQLLTPATHPGIPPSSYAQEASPSTPEAQSTVPSDRRGSGPAQNTQNQSYHYHPAFSQSRLPVQTQPGADSSLRRDEYQVSPAVQHFASSYTPHQGPGLPLHPSYTAQAPQISCSLQTQHSAPPNIPQPQQAASSNIRPIQHILSANAMQPQPLLPADTPAPYYPQYLGTSDMASGLTVDSEQSDKSSASNVKPLPRLVGERDVPGEGPSFIYEDGTTCKKFIDGEPVNAQWGVTKAGKPRKRLAIACTRCRDRKIKCDPAELKCLQCEKDGSECRFTTA